MNDEIAFFHFDNEPSLRSIIWLEIEGMVPGTFAYLMKFDKIVSDIGLNEQLTQSPAIFGGQMMFDDNSYVEYHDNQGWKSLILPRD